MGTSLWFYLFGSIMKKFRLRDIDLGCDEQVLNQLYSGLIIRIVFGELEKCLLQDRQTIEVL